MVAVPSWLRTLLRDLASQKLRTFLTIFGMFWGTVAVTLLLAFGEAIHRKQMDAMESMGDRIVIGWPSETTIPYAGFGRGRRIRLDLDDIAALRANLHGLDAISEEFSARMVAKVGDRKRNVDVSAVAPDYGRLRNMTPQKGGRFIDPLDIALKRRVAFLGNKIAQELFGDEPAVGKTVELDGTPFLVIGVLKPKRQEMSYSGRDANKVVIPSTTYSSLTGEHWISNFVMRAVDPESNDALVEEARRRLAARKKFSPKDKSAVHVWDTTEVFEFLNTFMFAFRGFLAVMGFFTLGVGAIGVSNIMHVVVEERTKEIGIRMALGQRPGSLLRGFLLETAVIVGCGGALGLLASVGIVKAAAMFPLKEIIGVPKVSATTALLTVAVLGIVGGIAGYFPAKEAASMDPVAAMKF